MNSKLRYLMCILFWVFFIENGIAQNATTITGKVVSADDKLGLPGATVKLKGTPIGVSTDVNGNYSIRISQSTGTLEFSFTGYVPQEVPIDSRSVINVMLTTDNTQLEEVVVVGYGTQRKETLTGAVSSISSADITTTKTENLISNLQGKVPGLQIRQKTGEPGVFNNLVSIRGYGEPLVVIDGMPRDGVSEFAQLNPNDIESISILKDASAAIYGMNAANGVILVTTKKGQKDNVSVAYSGLYGLKQATGLEQTVDAYTYRLMKNEMEKNIGNGLYYGEDVLEKYRIGEPGYTSVDWIGLMLHDAVPQQSHNVSVRGGSGKATYFSSLGYTTDNGLLTSDIQKYRRFNFRTNTSFELAKDLFLKLGISARQSHTQEPRNAFTWVFKPIIINDRGINYHTIANKDHLTQSNPYAMASEEIDGYQRHEIFQYQSNAELVYDLPFIQGLKASVFAAYDGDQGNHSLLQHSYDLYDYYTDKVVTTFGQDRYNNSISLFRRFHARGQLNYKHTFAKDHNLNLTAVSELRRTRSDDLYGQRHYEDIYTNDILDQATSTTGTNSGSRSYTALANYVGRANYDYKGKYLLEAAARYDGSYRYAPAKRWAFFPSVSAGWRISEERFIKDNLSFIDNLKLRASYGESGLNVGNAFAYIGAYSASSGSGYIFDPNTLTVGMIAPGVVNDNLTWVTSTLSNIGIDIDLWKGKLGASIDAFERRNEGILDTRIQSVPNTFGASFPQENINSTLNRGIELMLSHKGKIGREFDYRVSANATYARFKRLYVERAPYNSSWQRWKNGTDYRYTGRDWLYEHEGRYTSLEQYETAPLRGGARGNSKLLPGSYILTDVNGDGLIDGNDQTPDHWTFGDINPPLQYGMTMSGSFKSLDINVLLQGAALYSINYRNNDVWGYGRFPSLLTKYLDRWHTVNPSDDPYDPATQWIAGENPALRTNFNNTMDDAPIDVWTPPATYLRLKSLELGYSLPESLIRRVKVKKARIYLNGFNLFTLSRKELKNADPERQEGAFDADLTYPLMKSYNFGVNLTF